MPRYIDADSLKSSYQAFNGGKQDFFVSMIECTPTVDVAELKRGKWVEIKNAYGELEGWIHIECGRELKRKEEYCPHCGAKMGGKE